MDVLVDGFQEISRNWIIVNRDGHKLCAVFGGKFGVQPFDTKLIMDTLQAWKNDETAQIPEPTKSRRGHMMTGIT